jgi:hypothetical protein
MPLSLMRYDLDLARPAPISRWGVSRGPSLRSVVLALTTVLVGSPLPAQSIIGDPVALRFTIAEGILIAPATAGGVPIHVILDTGAGLDLLPPSLIAKLHGKPAGQFSAHRMTGERVDIPLFVVPEIAIGPVVTKQALVGGWDVLDSLNIDGIFSVNGFRRNALTIDFADSTLTFETPQSLARRRTAGRSSPLQVDDLRGTALDLFATFLIGDQPGQCELDTGSQTARASLRYLAALGIAPDRGDVVKTERLTITGATEVRYTTTVPAISLASAPAIARTGPRVIFSDLIYDCVIGTEFWSGMALTIDIADREIIVSGNPPAR